MLCELSVQFVFNLLGFFRLSIAHSLRVISVVELLSDQLLLLLIENVKQGGCVFQPCVLKNLIGSQTLFYVCAQHSRY